MDFFKSVFTEDPDPPSPTSKPESSPAPQHPTADSHPNPPTSTSNAGDGASIGGWSFGVLVKNLAIRSESVIETYRRDLQEFGSGLRQETVTLREVANRAVKDLPTSIEISASKAQGAFHSIAEIVAQGKGTLLAPDLDSDSSERVRGGGNLSAQSVGSGRYSRLDAQLRAIQGDVNTYVEEPEDVDDYNRWKLGFDLGDKGEEIEDLMRENGDIGGVYKRVVPTDVDHEGFWCRYYYRVHRLQQAESVRANLVQRAISKDDEEELSWDVDDDEEEEQEKKEKEKGNESSKDVTGVLLEGNDLVNNEVGSEVSGNSVQKASTDNVGGDQKGESSHNVVDEKKVDVVEPVEWELSNEEVSSEGASEEKRESLKKSAEEVVQEVRAAASESGKDSDVSVVSNQPSPEEEDLGWDEIEDLGSDDDKKVARIGVSSNTAELRKRLSTADDEEDLSWDIEDDDEPIKA